MFGKQWQKAECVVVAREVAYVNDGSVNYRYIVEVHPETGEPFRAIARLPFIATDFWSPNVGQAVGVLFDSATRLVKFDRHDPRLSAKAYERARDARFKAALDDQPGTRRATEDDRRELRLALLAR